MSHISNTNILEEADEQFGIALSEGDFLSCKGIIATLRAQGFDSEANELENEMNNTWVGEFSAHWAAKN